jgi:hypothetical protein
LTHTAYNICLRIICTYYVIACVWSYILLFHVCYSHICCPCYLVWYFLFFLSRSPFYRHWLSSLVIYLCQVSVLSMFNCLYIAMFCWSSGHVIPCTGLYICCSYENCNILQFKSFLKVSCHHILSDFVFLSFYLLYFLFWPFEFCCTINFFKVVKLKKKMFFENDWSIFKQDQYIDL